MVRGGRGYSSRGNSYRGSNRGSPWNGGGYGKGPRDRYSFDSGFDKPRFMERYPRDDYAKPYRMDNYGRERHSPERKRPRTEGPSRHEYGGRYEPYPSERRGYSSERERHLSSPYVSRREEFRKPPLPLSPRGGGRGRMSSRGPRGFRRERGGGPMRRLADRSYIIRRRGVLRSGEFTRRSSRMIRMRSSLVRRRRVVLSSEKESSEDEEETEEKSKEKEGEEAEGEDVEMKEEGAENQGEEGKEEKEGGVEKKPKEKKEKKTESEPKKPVRTFVTLICPQCNIKVPTFRRYEAHLQGKTHLFSMRKVAGKQRSILAQMRQAQRNAQNELEKSGEGITDHTVFCPMCKLNYKQERAAHQNSSAHKNMKKFLMPTCKVCKQTFKSPMVYEHHLCSIEHLKRKQRGEPAGDAEEDNLEEFTTIDSVGEVGDENTGSGEDQEKAEKKKKVSVGIELIKRIEAYYCDLCRMFLPRGTENEYPDILAGHCRKRFHMQRYVRHKENEDLKKRAEKLQRKETAEKEKKKTEDTIKKEGEEDAAGAEGKEDEIKEESKDMDTTKSTEDDKLWDAVDKDLGELLEETDGREDDDDEERMNGERYDRFKSAEKGDEEGGEASQKAEEANKVEEGKK